MKLQQSVGKPSTHPRRFFQLIWKQELTCESGVYMRRWGIETPWFSIRLHHWLKSDDKRALHDHPWAFYTFILKGGYIDVTEAQSQALGTRHTLRRHFRTKVQGGRRVMFREARHRHYVDVLPGGCWSLVLTGPKIRFWGFWVNGKFVKSNKYFLERGRHVCD